MNLLLLSRADALIGKARSSYALLAAGMSGGQAAGRPFYEVGKGRTCTRVTCEMLPGIQQVGPVQPIAPEALPAVFLCRASGRVLWFFDIFGLY